MTYTTREKFINYHGNDPDNEWLHVKVSNRALLAYKAIFSITRMWKRTFGNRPIE